MQLWGACLGLALLAAPQGAQAAADAGTAKAILMRSVAFRTVQGAGQVPKLAAIMLTCCARRALPRRTS